MKYWNVTFTANYFTLHTTINAVDEDDAVEYAIENLLEQYGFDVSKVAQCTEVEEANG
jgi:FixJ family two-component response regulator